MTTPDAEVIPADAQPGSASHPALSAMLEALQGSTTADPLLALRAQAEAQARDNPQLALLLRMLEQRQQAAMTAPAESDPPEGEDDLSVPSASPFAAAHDASVANSEGFQELRSAVDALSAELEVLRARNRVLARALGACFRCFGGDLLCEECDGHGVPGALLPEPSTFRRYVLPAWRRAQACAARRTQRIGPADPRYAAAVTSDDPALVGLDGATFDRTRCSSRPSEQKE